MALMLIRVGPLQKNRYVGHDDGSSSGGGSKSGSDVSFSIFCLTDPLPPG